MAADPSDTIARIRGRVREIPRGKVSTYGKIAEAAGVPRAARLVARSLSAAAGLPWHRVVAAGGRIALPGESGLDQRLRLEMEGVKFRGSKVRMADHEHRFAPSRKATAKAASKKSRGATK